MKRHAGLHRAEQLIVLSRRSVGATQALNAYKLLAHLLEEYDLAHHQLEQIEHELHHILGRIPYAQKLLEIRGVNAVNATNPKFDVEFYLFFNVYASPLNISSRFSIIT
ncbi:hypothetical protein [Paenibacillus sp. FSL A5-0031]|uniref:hypothetical protein n=1 Tax=Paenibacillus sp. FSL A5-0031 TaxID=1920420 RepID=UPI002116A01B|nr:hypothetical protein [Paenibacillus sp. FSL A5-0031]